MSKSLRDRARSISVASPPNLAQNEPLPAVALPTAAPAARKSNVGAKLLKKRQSVSYHHAPRVVDPSLEAQFRELHPEGRDLTAISEDAVEEPAGPSGGPLAFVRRANIGVDVDRLAADSFKADEYLKQNMLGNSGHRAGSAAAQRDDLTRIRGDLETIKALTEAELQRIVYANYPDFIVLSKEVTALEAEILSFKTALDEWRSVPDALAPVDTFSPSTGPRRNSLADLASMYKTQLSSLWDNVEGSQKLLPLVPGRHFVSEAASFVELHPATYRLRQAVHLFLFSDCLLVAVKKRAANAVRLVAERVYNLKEIFVVDLKDGGELTNAIKIKRGKESVIFRTDNADDKKHLLAAFKRVAEELINRKRMEMLHQAETRRADAAPAAAAIAETLGLDVVSRALHAPTAWIDAYADALAVAVATRAFEDAVVLLERGRTVLPLLEDDASARARFQEESATYTSQLASVLLQDLRDPGIRKSGILQAAAWLSRLGEDERAREAMLEGRAQLVHQRVAQMDTEDEVDIVLYVNELALVTFTLIKNTCEWYMAAFKNNQMASVFVKWAIDQFYIFAAKFRQLVYKENTLAPPTRNEVINESLEATKSHSFLLRDVGLDFAFLFSTHLKEK